MERESYLLEKASDVIQDGEYMPNGKSFIKLGIVYAIGQVLSKTVSFVLLPIYTRQLGAGGYGKLALVDTVLDFTGAFVIFGIYSGYYRFYREYDDGQRRRLKNTAINFALILGVLNILLIILVGEPISKIVFNFEGSYKILILAVVRSAIVQFVTLLLCDYTLNYRAVVSVLINLSNLVLNLFFSIYFVIYRGEGISGIYKGYIYGYGILLLYLVIINLNSYRLEIDRNMLRNMLKFSTGLIPANLASTVLTLSDRYFLSGYRNYEETGIYSIGYKIGMLIEPLFISPFNSVFTPYKFEIWKETDAQEKLNDMFEKYHFIGLFMVLAISFYSKIILLIATTRAFFDAYKIIPLILFSYFLYGKSNFYKLGIEIKNKTYIDSNIMIFGGLINIILNIILVPLWGMYGASIATCLSYLIMNFIYIKIALPMYHIKYGFRNVLLLYIICAVLYSLYYCYSVVNMPLIVEFAVNAFLLIIYIFLCSIFNIIDINKLMEYKNILFGKSFLKKKIYKSFELKER